MTTQPEALRLANDIQCVDSACKCSMNLAAAELRRLHARIAELEKEVAHVDSLLGKANALARIRAHRIAELEAQLEAIGAGGVSGPLMGIASPPTAQAEGWISVAERLPEAYVTVLLTIDGNHITAGEYMHNLSCFIWDPHDDETDDSQATHWMPLPPPPTASAGSGKGE